MINDTFVYKTAADCQVKLDLFRPDVRQRRVPVVVWIHGGALISGVRTALDSRPGLRDFLLENGVAVAAIDYRLAPETKLPGILEDLRDAFAWIVNEASAYGLDPSRIATIGHSAGDTWR